jgi:hypothetical protein
MGEMMRMIHMILSLDLGSEKGERRLRNNLDNSFLRWCFWVQFSGWMEGDLLSGVIFWGGFSNENDGVLVG